MKILVIGVGTIGLPFGLLLSNNGHEVDFLDKDLERIEQFKNDDHPYILEKKIRDLYAAQKNKLRFFHSEELAMSYDVVVFATSFGGDKDEASHLYAQYAHLCFQSKIVLFRSTLNFRQWEKLLPQVDMTNWVYAPERSRPGNIIDEIQAFPQIIGSESREAFTKVFELRNGIVKECVEAKVVDAIAAKLLTNAWRASLFDLSNKFFLDCRKRGLSYSHICSLAKKDYPRLDSLPLAGFISGPCLPKDYDSWQSWETEGEQPNDRLNIQILQDFLSSLLKECPMLSSQRVALYGSSYRVDLRDDRNSVSKKLENILSELGGEIKSFQVDEKEKLAKWKPDLVVHLFPELRPIEQFSYFDYWSM
jgi:nucleotide sugar dehydrogenase